jgi:hypothetical protein
MLIYEYSMSNLRSLQSTDYLFVPVLSVPVGYIANNCDCFEPFPVWKQRCYAFSGPATCIAFCWQQGPLAAAACSGGGGGNGT